ncbi:unnamed protein product [Polarella glacialis]|uniref:Uncharacterized protein n=1 Tax=Polarella glacialis TaxID=89957 RepID=A0A813HYC6_POLGL|nr:unnamed protein product [Polarella glacialis]
MQPLGHSADLSLARQCQQAIDRIVGGSPGRASRKRKPEPLTDSQPTPSSEEEEEEEQELVAIPTLELDPKSYGEYVGCGNFRGKTISNDTFLQDETTGAFWERSLNSFLRFSDALGSLVPLLDPVPFLADGVPFVLRFTPELSAPPTAVRSKIVLKDLPGQGLLSIASSTGLPQVLEVARSGQQWFAENGIYVVLFELYC